MSMLPCKTRTVTNERSPLSFSEFTFTNCLDLFQSLVFESRGMSGGQVAADLEESVNRRAGLIFYVLMYTVQCVSLILCLYK